MLLPILLFDVALVAWSLHLMERAYESKEFSLMLAGTLVALAAAAMLVVYFFDGTLYDLFVASVVVSAQWWRRY